MCEAQERYQLLQGQLASMAQDCQHEIANKDVAWRQEYGKLQSAANYIFEEAQAQHLELQKLQSQLQQDKRQEMA